jgi:hypothetical protein
MKATITVHRAEGVYSARTENNILIVFTVESGENIALGEELEVDLPSLVESRRVTRLKDQSTLRIKLSRDDLHDLDLPPNHGSSRTPSPGRMKR